MREQKAEQDVGHRREDVRQPHELQVSAHRRNGDNSAIEAAQLIEQPAHVAMGFAGRVVGVVDVGIQLDGQPAVVAGGGDRLQRGLEVDRPAAGNQVAVHARVGDVLEVVVPGVRLHRGDPMLRVLADAKGVADVEVQAHPRRIDPPHEIQILLELLDHQVRLGLDQQATPTLSATSTQGINSS